MSETDYPTLINQLRDDLLAAKEAAETLRGERRAHALDAYGGDPQAQEAIAAIDARARDAQLRVDTLEAALEEAVERAADVERELSRKDHEHKLAVAADYVDTILACGALVDDLANQIVSALKRRQETLRGLARLDVMDINVVLDRERVFIINGALAAAGLRDFAAIEHVSPPFWTPLAEADRCLDIRLRADNPTEAAA